MFQIGDQVCYPMHGIGKIEKIQEQSILGELTHYYVLTFNNGSMTAMVPVNTAESVGVRYLVDEKQSKEVLKFFSQKTEEEEYDNWNQRYRDNLDKLRNGDILLEAQVVKCLATREKDKGLSTGERKMFVTAKKVLFAELQAVLGTEESELEEALAKGL